MTATALTRSDLNTLSAYSAAGNFSDYYGFLISKGYAYGQLALDVVLNQGSGLVAREFAANVGLMQSTPVVLDGVDWADISLRLMRSDYAALDRLFLDSNPSEAPKILELPVDVIRRYHTDAFAAHDLPAEAWTAYVPTLLSPNQQATWEGMISAGQYTLSAINYGGWEAVVQGWNVLLNNQADLASTWLKAMFVGVGEHAPAIKFLYQSVNELAWLESYQVTGSNGLIVSGGTEEANVRALPSAGTLIGYGGDDKLTGSSGDDIIFGGDGSDTLYGGAGNDILVGGNHRYEVDDGYTDYASYTSHGYSIISRAVDGGLIVYDGQGGQDTLYGVEEFIGSQYDDEIVGSVYTPNLNGGAGADTFIVFGGETIKDADASDYVSFFGFLQPTGGIAFAAFEDPIAYQPTGFAYRMLDGDLNSAEGGTLQVQFLWFDSFSITLEHYNRDFNTFTGDAHIEIYRETYGPRSDNWLDIMIKGYQSAFGNDPVDPLILDLDGNGFGLRDNGNGVYFNIDGGNFANRVGWTSGGDGFLVRDLNGNGKIDHIGEMFGNATLGGFAALDALDNVNNDIINSADSAWSSLKIWVDADRDGVTDAGELQSLAYHNITSINLTSTASGAEVNGNTIVRTATFTRADSTTGAIADVALERNPMYTKYVGSTTPSVAAQALPWLHGWGRLANLDVAMTQDATLLSLVNTLDTAAIANPSTFDTSVTNILYRWAGAQSISPTGRGAHINGQKLAFVEAFTGQAFVSQDNGTANPSADEAEDLLAIWDNAFSHAKTLLLVQGPYASYFSSLTLDKALDAFVPNEGYYLREALKDIFDGMPTNAAAAQTYWDKFAPLVKELAAFVMRPNGTVGLEDAHLATDVVAAMIGRGLPLSAATLLTGLLEYGHVVSGSGTVTGGGDNDILIGQGQNFTLMGEKGSDTYVLGENFGQVVISENSGVVVGNIFDFQSLLSMQVDTLRFATLRASDVTLSRDGDDLLITVKATSDSVRVLDHFGHVAAGGNMLSRPDHAIEQIVFADGVAKTSVDIRGDIITAQQTDGHDSIVGSSDNDLFKGGLGNDTLVGGNDGDLYIFNKGDGQDVIRDVMDDPFLSDPDILLLGSGIDVDDVVLTRVGDDLQISFTDSSDSILVKDQFWATVLGYGQFNTLTTTVAVIGNNPLNQLASYTTYPDGFDSEGYTNHSGITVTENPLTGELEVSIDGLDYTYVAQESDDAETPEIFKVPAPNRRLEAFSFANGTTLTAAQLQQLMLDRAGTSGNDSITGFIESDTLDGGAGNDTLSGGNDGDTYVFKTGYGHDVIDDQMTNVLFKAPDIVTFGEGITKDSLIFSRVDNDLVIHLKNNTSDSLTIKNQFDSTVLGLDNFFSLDNRIEELHFANGTTTNWLEINQALLKGTSGDDVLTGYFSNDVLNGGAGNDTLRGGDMGDVYVFNYGYGHDVIEDNMTSVLFKDNDKLVFGPGITKSDVALSRVGESDDLRITLKSTGETITIKNQFNYSIFGPNSIFSINYAIEEFHFSDGSAWSTSDIQTILLTGTSGNDQLIGFFRQDTLDGGAGNDYLAGGDEGDTYIFATGYGNDTIWDLGDGFAENTVDKVVFTGLASTAVTFSRGQGGNDLVATITASGEKLTILDQNNVNTLGVAYNQIEEFHFTDKVVSAAEALAKILSVSGTSGNDVIYGFSTDDTLDGGAGNDTLYGGEGSDTYIWGTGKGHDVIRESSFTYLPSNDTVKFTADLLPSHIAIGRNANRNDVVLTVKATGETLTIKDIFQVFNIGPLYYAVENFAFNNGTVWDMDYLRAALLQTTSGADKIIGFYSDDYIDGGAGNDTLDGGDGSDTYFFDYGDGHDVIFDQIQNVFYDTPDTLKFSSAISASAIQLSRSGENLVVNFTGHSGDSVTIQNYFFLYNEIENFSFNGASFWNKDQIIARLIGATSGNDSIVGNANSDTLSGGAGNDTIDGGAEYQYLWGGDGNDTYKFGVGDKYDVIEERSTDSLVSGSDTILIKGGLLLSDLTFERLYDDLFIGIAGNDTDKIRIINQFGAAASQVESLTVNSVTYSLNTLLTTTTAGNDNLIGSNGNDYLLGGAGNDTLSGGYGDDTLDGGIGNDSLMGKEDDDTYIFNVGYGHDTISDFPSGEDTILLGAGFTRDNIVFTRSGLNLTITFDGYAGDSITIINQFDPYDQAVVERITFSNGASLTLQDIQALTLKPTSGDDLLLGYETNDTIYAGAGNDTVDGKGGNNLLYGESGNDSITAYDGNDSFYGGDGNDTLVAFAGNDLLYGESGNDSLVSGSGYDSLYGGVGNDTLVGATYTHVLDGGSGDDLIQMYENTAVTLIGGAGNDTLDVLSYRSVKIDLAASTVRFYDGASPVTPALSMTGIENAIGNSANDTLIGDSLANYLSGGENGNDSLSGGLGDDTLNGVRGNDTLNGGDGFDFVEYLGANQGWNVNLTTNSAVGQDSETDTLVAIEGVIGSAFADTINGSSGNNILRGEAGDDSISAQAGNDTLAGGYGNDTLDGGSGNDLLHGDAGRDSILGGNNNDTLIGGAQNDVLQGGAGNDTYLYSLGDGEDTITDNSGTNVLEFGEGINLADVVFVKINNDLQIQIPTKGFVTVASHFAGAANQLASIKFANGTTINATNIASLYVTSGARTGDQIINGTGSADTLRGYDGDDSINGGSGDDTYIYNPGDGNDTIYDSYGNDILRLGTGIGLNDFSFRMVPTIGYPSRDLLIRIGNDAEIRIVEGFSGGEMEAIEYDGGSLTYQQVRAIIMAQQGTPDNDTITGFDGADSISGGAGNDSITGGFGNDTLNGGPGADTLDGYWDNNTASYSGDNVGVDVDLNRVTQIGGEAQGDELYTISHIIGGSGNDTLTGDSLANYLEGGAGNDLLTGGAGADTLVGGDGVDTLSYAASGAINVNLASATTQSGGHAAGDILSGIEHVIGGTGNDKIFGNSAANSLSGGNGTDSLVGNDGNDTLVGGAGADTLSGGAGNDTASYAASTAAVVVNLTPSASQSGGDAAGDSLSGIENIIGSAYHDLLTGYTDANSIFGGAGNDTISAGDGNDTLQGGAGADSLVGGNGMDTASYELSGAAVNINLGSTQSGGDAAGDTLSSIEYIIGSAYNDTLAGDANANSITGGAGNDSITGGAGADTLAGGDGLDTVSYTASSAGVNVNLTLATSQSGGDAAGDVISGFENIIGGAGNDTLTGNADANTLDGGAGNDTLMGGAGADSLNGGSNTDTASYANDTVGVNVNLTLATSQSGGEAAGDTLASIENVTGGAGADSLTGTSSANVLDGGAGNDTLYGGAGADTLKGGDGLDTVSYAGTSWTAVNVDLALATSQSGGDAAGDVLSDIEHVLGGRGNDTIYGNSGNNYLTGGTDGSDAIYGRDGDDTIVGGSSGDLLDGGNGIDVLSYAGSSSAVNVNLNNSVQSWSDAHGDTISNFENVIGSAYNDILTGNSIDNVLDGGDGNDTILGGLGADTLIGGGGVDQVSYAGSAAAVNINLTLATSQSGGAAAGDVLSGFENILGSSYNDTLTGDAGANSLDGGAGNDTLMGGAGADTLNGGSNTDTVSYANDTIGVNVNLTLATSQSGGEAAGDILSNFENVTGGSGNDSLTGTSAANVLQGNGGNDTLTGGAGADTLMGDDGFDVASYLASAVAVNVNLGLSTSQSGGDAGGDILQSIEGVIGSAYNDTLTGNGDANSLVGGAGNDFIIGGAGADTLHGGDGIDTLSYATSAAINVNLSLVTQQFGGDAAGDVITGIEHVIGGSGNDTIFGSASANSLTGGSGDDLISGGAGADTLDGGTGGVDTVSYATSTTGVNVNLTLATSQSGGDAAGDILSNFENITGGFGNDSLTGDANANSLVGGAGNDTLFGGAGADTLVGGDGIDRASYATSSLAINVNLTLATSQSGGDAAGDILVSIEDVLGGYANDTITGSSEANSINGGAGWDVLYGGAGNDTLQGGTSGSDKLYGEDGNDLLDGGDAADTLDGGVGVDTLTGGTGADRFVFSNLGHSTDSAQDIITDFTQGTDKIDLTGLGFTGIASGAGLGGVLGFSKVAGNTIIVDADSDFSIQLTGDINLVASDFVF